MVHMQEFLRCFKYDSAEFLAKPSCLKLANWSNDDRVEILTISFKKVPEELCGTASW